MTPASYTQGQTLDSRQSQEQTLSAEQFHGLDLLAAPVMALDAKISEEQQSNPVLELVSPELEAREKEENDEAGKTDEEKRAEENIEDPDLPHVFAGGSDSEVLPKLDENRDDFTESLESYLENSDGGDNYFLPGGGNPDDAEKHEFMFNSIAAARSIQEQLLEQLRFSDCPPHLRRAAREIVGNIGETGYFESAPGEIAQTCACSEADAEEALKWVQTFDPPGIAARNLRECLLLQLERKKPDGDTALLIELVRDHLDDLARNRLPGIAKAMDIPIEQLKRLTEKLKKLDPHPGGALESVGPDTQYIVPEVTVEPDGSEFKVVPDREFIPRLRLSKTYMDMLDDPNATEEVKKYIREKAASARQLMNLVTFRGSTIQRIAELIVAGQHDFFEFGPKALKPMTMGEIAEKLGRQESTVSRAIAGKYMRTPRGLVPFRSFFSGGFTSASGETVSARGVKELMREIVAGEDPKSPYSDSRLEALLAERGFTVARRTLVKYRDELGIPKAQLRRTY